MVTDEGPEVRDSRSQHGFHVDQCFHQAFRKLWKEASAARLECGPRLGKFIRARRGQESGFRLILSCKGTEKVNLMFSLPRVT